MQRFTESLRMPFSSRENSAGILPKPHYLKSGAKALFSLPMYSASMSAFAVHLPGKRTKEIAAIGFLSVSLLLPLSLQSQRRPPYAIAMQPAAATPRVGGHAASVQGYLGIMFRDISDSTATACHLKDKRGAEIVMVDHDGPAGKAGLREHDIIITMNGVVIEHQDQLRKLLHDAPAGRNVTLLINRDGSERTLTATLSTREEVDRQARLQRWSVPAPIDDSETAPPPTAAKSKNSTVFGHSFMPGRLIPLLPIYTGAELNAVGTQLADYFGVKDGVGLLVQSVEGNSPAATAGLRAGDVVIRLNGTRITTEREWTRNLHDSRGKPITITVMRDRREQVLTMIADGQKRGSMEKPPEITPSDSLQMNL